ncbi:MAG: ferredoxin family protein [Deltaproteobacteria bacterium]|nr:ferredoxin family protein [Deltaproteobacteria bacterium]
MNEGFSIDLNFEVCDGCGLCLEVCPEAIFDFGSKPNAKGLRPPVAARPNDCLGCLSCSMGCPNFCLEVKRSSVASLKK